MPATPETAPAATVLAFDFGLRRIGAAVGQPITGSASPLGTVSNGPSGPDWAGIERLVSEWRPQRLIVGLPTRADGSSSAITTAVLQFVAELDRFGLAVETVDERYSSLEASARLGKQRRQGLRGRVHKKAVDAAAAVVIAERWLAEHAGSNTGPCTNSAASE
jgi:putative holliday junction resolvase